jgi:hypothetical protein
MSNFRRWLGKRIGRRNLPFLLAVLALAVVIVVLMVISPGTENANDPRSPVVVATD